MSQVEKSVSPTKQTKSKDKSSIDKNWKLRRAVKKNGASGSCKLCNAVVKTCGNTTNLKQHLKRKHPSVPSFNLPAKSQKSSKSLNTHGRELAVEENEDDPQISQIVHQSMSQFGTQSTLDDTVITSRARPSSQMSQCSESDSVISKSSESISSISNFTSISGASSSTRFAQPTIDQTINELRSFGRGGAKSLTVTNALVYMLVKDNMPLSSTEKDGFKHFMKKVMPLYKVPSRKTITQLITSKYDILSTQIKNKLSLIESVTLTTDIWTDTLNTKSFLGMTAHYLSMSKLELESATLGVLELDERHTSDNIVGWIKDLLNRWGIEKDQVFLVVTDSGCNIKSAVYNYFGKEKHLPCLAHTLNLVVQNALVDTKNIANIITKVKNLVTFFKQLVSASDELHKICKYKLKQSVPTRWNSVFYMLDRFKSCSDSIASTIVKFPNGPPMLSGSELFSVNKMICLLKPFEAATKELCGQNYITGSKIIPLMHCLLKKIEVVEVGSDLSSELKNNLLQNLKSRFGRVEFLEILSVATILDPRFKTLHCNDAIACSKAINTIKNKIVDLRIDCNESSSNTGNSSNDEDTDNLWSIHKELVNKKTLNETSMRNNMATDLRHYLNQPTLPLGENVLKFWDTHGPIYPYLKKIVNPYLSMVATSVPSGRLFSKAGQVMTDSRNRLTGEHLNKLLFLGSLSESDWNLD